MTWQVEMGPSSLIKLFTSRLRLGQEMGKIGKETFVVIKLRDSYGFLTQLAFLKNWQGDLCPY